MHKYSVLSNLIQDIFTKSKFSLHATQINRKSQIMSQFFAGLSSDLITKAKLAANIKLLATIRLIFWQITLKTMTARAQGIFSTALIVVCAFAWLPFAVEMCVTQLCSLSACASRLRFTANRYPLPTETLWPFVATC